MIVCWVAFIDILSRMQPAGSRLGIPARESDLVVTNLPFALYDFLVPASFCLQNSHFVELLRVSFYLLN